MSSETWGTISSHELTLFRELKDIEVVFDIGARENTDYLTIKPHATYHLFEPNPVFFEYLKKEVGHLKNVHLNNFGIVDEGESRQYMEQVGWYTVPCKTLDEYIKENNITRLDFLKTDTEGYDYKIFSSSPIALGMAKYIQYEYWNDKDAFYNLLNPNFDLYEMGIRNVFGIRRHV